MNEVEVQAQEEEGEESSQWLEKHKEKRKPFKGILCHIFPALTSYLALGTFFKEMKMSIRRKNTL